MLRHCEVCSAALTDWQLRGGGVLQRCPVCRHVLRDLTACPATMRELGYGSGALLRRLLDDGWSVGGVDTGQLEVGTDPEVVRRGALTRGELETASLDGRYDLVVGVHVLEHLRDPAKGLARAYELLRPGGVLALITPTADSVGPEWIGAAWWLLEDPTHLRFFSPDSARRALAAAGFAGTTVRRLALDNLSMEVASLRRRTGRSRPAGVLAERSTIVAALATAPATVAARLLLPRLRPSLELLARRPG